MTSRKRRVRHSEPVRTAPNPRVRRAVLMWGLSAALVMVASAVFYRQVVENEYLQGRSRKISIRIKKIFKLFNRYQFGL